MENVLTGGYNIFERSDQIKNYSFFKKKTSFLRQKKGSFFIIEKNRKGGMISYFGQSMQRQMIFFKTNPFSGTLWRRETKTGCDQTL